MIKRIRFQVPRMASVTLALTLLLHSLSVTRMANTATTQPALRIAGLRTEYKQNPIGIDIRKPRLAWELHSDSRAVSQSAYQLRVATTRQALTAGRDLTWDSGKVNSSESTHAPYDGPPLKSGSRYFWQVRVWDERDTASEWSEPAFWEMGLLEPSDWKADWIEADLTEDVSKPAPSPMFRSRFNLKGEVEQARAYVTSRGLYELYLNGSRVSDQLFTPGWTSYNKRIQYQTYDVTGILRQGANAVGAILGSGWYRGQIGFQGQRNRYGAKLSLLCQIRVTYKG